MNQQSRPHSASKLMRRICLVILSTICFCAGHSEVAVAQCPDAECQQTFTSRSRTFHLIFLNMAWAGCYLKVDYTSRQCPGMPCELLIQKFELTGMCSSLTTSDIINNGIAIAVQDPNNACSFPQEGQCVDVINVSIPACMEIKMPSSTNWTIEGGESCYASDCCKMQYKLCNFWDGTWGVQLMAQDPPTAECQYGPMTNTNMANIAPFLNKCFGFCDLILDDEIIITEE